MKTSTIILVLAVLIVRNSSYLIKVPTEPVQQPDKIDSSVPVGWVHLQKLIIPLFEDVCEESIDPVVQRLAKDFTFDALDGEYLKSDVITNLQKLKSEKGFLPKGEIFTEYDPDHMNELKTIYEVMYYAKNFDTFYKMAAWARQNLNCGLFVSAIYLAIQNRRDTDKLSIPAPYEVLPNYFIQKDVIVQASKLLSNEEIISSEGIHEDGNAYTLDANYTAPFYDNEDESKLAYFREDIGLNAYYFLRKLKEAPWFNSDINSGYGENMYQMMKQFMARYDLEIYANGLPELNSMDWNSSLDVPYDPMLIYADGNEFIHRTGPLQLPENDNVALMQTIENNIGEVVKHMREAGYNKTQMMNHIMEILVTGDRSYENLARQLLGKCQSDNRYLSVLEHYMTSLRDPMFWIINKKIVEMVDNALQLLPPYSRNELFFPGVEIINIDIKKMMTVLDYYEFDVTNALKISDGNTTFQVKIGQPRLNHKPFSIKVNISSLVSCKGLVKIYIGPKILPGELAMKKNNFVLLDVFEYSFKMGTNIITRTSDDMKQFSKDFMSLSTIQKKVQYAEFGLDSLPLLPIKSQVGYPDRFVLPKGTFEGLPLQILVFVAPFVKSFYNSLPTDVAFNAAIMSPGYPLDLIIDNKILLNLPNAMLKDVVLTHKGDSKVENYGGSGVTKKWYGKNTYDPSVRMTEKKPFDYASKKGQYGSKGKNVFDVQNNEETYRNLDSLENDQNAKDNIQTMESKFLLASSKSGFDYLKNKKEKPIPLNYNVNKGDFYMKPEDKKFIYKDNPEKVQYNSNILNEDAITSKVEYFPDNKEENEQYFNPEKHLLGSNFNYEAKTEGSESELYNFKPNREYGNKGNFSPKMVHEKFDYKAKKDQYRVKPDNSSPKELERVVSVEDSIPTVRMPIDSDGDNEIIQSIKKITNVEENELKSEDDEDVFILAKKNYEVIPLRKLGLPIKGLNK